MENKAPNEPPHESGDPAAEDEKLLVRKARQGELGAYDELVRRYQERIYATVYHMTANHEDASDLTQDAFIKAYQAINRSRAGRVFTPGFTG